MLKTITTNKFEKDIKIAQKRGYELNKLMYVMNEIVNKRALPKKFLDHTLKGDYNGYRECHVEPDWLLIYFIEPESVKFVRTGTHSDLFK
jgi:mRNA interferase YafQ